MSKLTSDILELQGEKKFFMMWKFYYVCMKCAKINHAFENKTKAADQTRTQKENQKTLTITILFLYNIS